MPIEVSRFKPGCQYDFDLRSEFHFQLIKPDLSQKFRHLFKVVEISRFINQGWHLFPGDYWSPTVTDPFGYSSEVNAKGDFGVICEETHGVQSPGAGRHQGGGADYTFIQYTKDCLIHRMAHPKIIGVDDQ